MEFAVCLFVFTEPDDPIFVRDGLPKPWAVSRRSWAQILVVWFVQCLPLGLLYLQVRTAARTQHLCLCACNYCPMLPWGYCGSHWGQAGTSKFVACSGLFASLGSLKSSGASSDPGARFIWRCNIWHSERRGERQLGIHWCRRELLPRLFARHQSLKAFHKAAQPMPTAILSTPTSQNVAVQCSSGVLRCKLTERIAVYVTCLHSSPIR